MASSLHCDREIFCTRVFDRSGDVGFVLHKRDDLRAAHRVHGPACDGSVIARVGGGDDVAFERGFEGLDAGHRVFRDEER